MRSSKGLRALVIALCVGAAIVFAYRKLDPLGTWSRRGGEVHSALGNEILVMRTPGGLLEVSTLRAYEQFDTKFVYSVLGVRIGETVPHIRVPAVYRYHIELAREWPVQRSDDVFTVVAPEIRPSLPVAVDLGRMEKDVGGTWVLVPFNGTEDLDTLERGITAKLAEKAASPAYLQLQREAARKTVAEFVRKWLVTQDSWKGGERPQIRVRFADEPAPP